MKKIVFLLFIVIFFKSGYSQNNPFSNTDDTKTLQKVTDGAMYILRQDYYMLDTTVKGEMRYGLNKKEYFGRFYFIAMAANGKFVVDKAINSPWELDSNYHSFIGSNKYKPELGELAYKNINEKKFTILATIDSSRFSKNEAFCQIKCPDSTKLFSMLAIHDSLLMDTTAWFWSADVKVDDKSEEITVQLESSKGKYSPTKGMFINTKFLYSENTKGGFIFSTVPEFGVLKYYLSGLIIKRNNKFSFVSLKGDGTASVNSVKTDQKTNMPQPALTLDVIPSKKEEATSKKKKKRKRWPIKY